MDHSTVNASKDLVKHEADNVVCASEDVNCEPSTSFATEIKCEPVDCISMPTTVILEPSSLSGWYPMYRKVQNDITTVLGCTNFDFGKNQIVLLVLAGIPNTGCKKVIYFMSLLCIMQYYTSHKQKLSLIIKHNLVLKCHYICDVILKFIDRNDFGFMPSTD